MLLLLLTLIATAPVPCVQLVSSLSVLTSLAARQRSLLEVQQALLRQLDLAPAGSHSKRGSTVHARLQVHVPNAIQVGAIDGACLASASSCAGATAAGASPVVVSVMVSNATGRTMPTPEETGLVVTVRILQSTCDDDEFGGCTTLTTSLPFPSSTWTEASTLQIPLTLDAHLLDAAEMHVQLAIRVETEMDGSGESQEEEEEARLARLVRSPLTSTFVPPSPSPQCSTSCSTSGASTSATRRIYWRPRHSPLPP